MDLPDAGHPRDRDPDAPSPDDDGWRFLHRLIRTVDGPQATFLADRLIDEFGDACATMSASPARLHRILPLHPEIVELLSAARDLLLHSLDRDMRERPVLANDMAVRDYLFAHMAYQPAEQVRTLLLDAKNQLLRDDIVAWGTVNRVDISPREIVRRALDAGATGLILAHNHPSGDPAPSLSDLSVTRDIVQAARLFEIKLLDHIIVARQGFYSFRAEGRL